MYQFSTSEYERTHGKAPKGIGQWWFEVREWKNGEPQTIWEAQINGTLTEAKKKAVAAAKAAGLPKYSTITVCP